jgi:hypothetical protein
MQGLSILPRLIRGDDAGYTALPGDSVDEDLEQIRRGDQLAGRGDVDRPGRLVDKQHCSVVLLRGAGQAGDQIHSDDLAREL